MNEHWPRKRGTDPRVQTRQEDQKRQEASISSTEGSGLRYLSEGLPSRQSQSFGRQTRGESRQPHNVTSQRRPARQHKKATQAIPPPMTTDGSLADHFAIHRARNRKGLASQLRHDLYAKETGKPCWDDGEPIAEEQADSWDNSFGGLGNEISLGKTLEKKRNTNSELLVIDLTTPKVQPPDPAEELRKARAEQAAKTAAAWREVRATYNRRAPQKR